MFDGTLGKRTTVMVLPRSWILIRATALGKIRYSLTFPGNDVGVSLEPIYGKIMEIRNGKEYRCGLLSLL